VLRSLPSLYNSEPLIGCSQTRMQQANRPIAAEQPTDEATGSAFLLDLLIVMQAIDEATG
jgi:hypothetical protein